MSLIFSLLLISTVANAESHGKSLGAHVHGTIKIEMAVEGKSLDLSIDGPAESFVGFEYSPKTSSEKKSWSAAEKTWNTDLLTKLFILDKNLGCKITSASFKQEMDKDENKDAKKEAGIHSDINAEAKVTCAKELKGQNLIVALKKNFPKIKKLAVEFIGSVTKTIDIQSDEQTIKL